MLRNDSQGKSRLRKESLCVSGLYVYVYVCVCKWGAGVDDQSVPGMRNDGKWSYG